MVDICYISSVLSTDFMSSSFEILKRCASGRIGKLTTPHGVVETPTVMPVINPNIRLVSPSKMKDMGAEILITNSYIIYRSKKLADHALTRGLHSLLEYDGPIMTDSGSFQLSVYGEVEVTNEQIIDFQHEIGSDIAVPLDIPTPPDVSHERAKDELEITIGRLKNARDHLSGSALLAGPIQGSTFNHLRTEAAKKVSEMGFDIYPIGAVVPLMESYRYADLVDVIVSSKKGLNPSSPVHLFGAGHPMMFSLAVALGCDLLDSAAYALYAKDERYITPHGTFHLSGLKYLPCSCPICQNYTPDDIRNSDDPVTLLAEHNLYVTFEEIRRVKQAVHDGNLLELVEMRCRSHPRLLEALERLYSYSDWLEISDPISKSTFFYCGAESAKRPEVIRFSKRMERLNIDGSAIIRPAGSNIKINSDFDHILEFKSPFGAYPVELGEVYPFNAESPSVHGSESLGVALENTIRLIELNPGAEFTFMKPDHMKHPLFEKLSTIADVVHLSQ